LHDIPSSHCRLHDQEYSLKDDCSAAFYGETATIKVGTGSDQQSFHVHRELLSFYSQYFRAAFNGDFAEAESGVVELETEDPAVFASFVAWLYTRKIRTDQIDTKNSTEYFLSIVKLWIFADRRQIPLLMNEMIDTLQQVALEVKLLPTSSFQEVYKNTSDNSLLRRMLVDMSQRLGSETLAECMTRHPENFPKDYLFDMVKAQLSTSPPVRLCVTQYGKLELCPFFHVHEDGANCMKKGTKRSRGVMEM
jgi:hypothetical protein